PTHASGHVRPHGLRQPQPGLSNLAPLLDVRNLRTWFHTRAGEARAVDGVDLALEQGGTLCLVGESGCGKTVTALSIMGLVDRPGRIMPGSEVVFAGRDLAASTEDELREARG